MKNFQDIRYNKISKENILQNWQDNPNYQLPDTIRSLYTNYIRYFEAKEIAKIDNILNSLIKIDPDSPILNLIYGEMALYRGVLENSHAYLLKYIKHIKQIDSYGLCVIARWNELAGNYKLACSQYTEALAHSNDNNTLVKILLSSINCKKNMRFLDTSLSYLNRLLAVPEGYYRMMQINLEIIHILIFKGKYSEAGYKIEQLAKIGRCKFVERLRLYLLFQQGEYKEILIDLNESDLDPYTAYLIARIGVNEKKYGIAVEEFLNYVIERTGGNEYVYNTYGCYHYKIKQITEAAEQFDNSLYFDSQFSPAKLNFEHVAQYVTRTEKGTYVATGAAVAAAEVYDSDPEPGSMGFFNLYELQGYLHMCINKNNVNKLMELRYEEK